jgi:SpoVK/Ycf46/Vps4 family AAA+-type ATPase
LTLANLLEVLDGVMEMEGRMLVITTNYPEKLDKALIRPGRYAWLTPSTRFMKKCSIGDTRVLGRVEVSSPGHS